MLKLPFKLSDQLIADSNINQWDVKNFHVGPKVNTFFNLDTENENFC